MQTIRVIDFILEQNLADELKFSILFVYHFNLSRNFFIKHYSFKRLDIFKKRKNAKAHLDCVKLKSLAEKLTAKIN